ncbi:MAG TPA: MFS transporter [Bryobacteraceae bacterium]|nr:MFS transporter [Bryobacteraceae bacterium]
MASHSPRQVSSSQATRVRHWVVVFAVALAVITYVDRVCISWAAPFITHDLQLSTVQMGYAFAAFGWAYAIFEIPGGFMGDWMGPRRVLLRIVLWWSFFTAATGWAWNFVSLSVTRFLFGVGEAGCFPNLTKTFTTWLPDNERVRAQSTMWLAARWGGAFTPPLVKYVIDMVGWRHAFEVFGCLGLVWALFFFRWYRDNPLDHPKMNEVERDLVREGSTRASGHGDVPWRKFLASQQVWMLCWQYFCLSYGWYFYITWLPTYLKEGRHLALTESALLSVLPLFFGGLGNPASYFLAKRLDRVTHSVAQTRKILAYIAFAGASGFLVGSTMVHNPVLAVLCIGLASFCNDLVMPGAWAAAMDVGGKYAGTLSGAMNMWGNVGGAISPMAIGYMLKWTHSNWAMTFYVSAIIYALGILFWMFLDPVTPLDQEEA